MYTKGCVTFLILSTAKAIFMNLKRHWILHTHKYQVFYIFTDNVRSKGS